jgi:hypothetical protein
MATVALDPDQAASGREMAEVPGIPQHARKPRIVGDAVQVKGLA